MFLNEEPLSARSFSFPPPSAVAEENGLHFAPAATTEPFFKALAMSPSQPAPLHNLLKSHLQRRDHTACVETFWNYWPGIRSYRLPAGGREATESVDELRTKGSQEIERGNPERYGDGWAWGAWRGRNARSVAGAVEVAASCFVGLGRLVRWLASFVVRAEKLGELRALSNVLDRTLVHFEMNFVSMQTPLPYYRRIVHRWFSNNCIGWPWDDGV